MAAKPDIPPPPPAGEAGAPKKKRFKLILIAGVGVLLLVVLVAVAAILLMPSADEDEDTPDQAAKVKTAASSTPIFMEIDTFTVNLLSEGGDQYLQLAVTLELASSEVADKVRLYMPRLRNQVMLLLSGKKPADLASKEGKELLARELRDEINSVIAPATPGGKQDTPVRAVLFTSFIVQ